MKQPIYIAIIAFAITSCGTKNTETKNTLEKTRIDSIQIFKSILNGNWYQESYIDSIQNTKSPFISRNSLAEYVELDISVDKNTGDSLEIDAPGIHEGNSFTIYFKPGMTSTSLPTNIVNDEKASNFYELGYSISVNDTSLILYTYNKDKQIINTIKYLKAPTNSEGPLQYMVNKTLFTGSYKAIDSSGQISTLKFTSDGALYGLPNFKKYYVLTDFVAESDNCVDQVCFDIQTNNQRCYGFNIRADTINLYDLVETMNTTQFGRLKLRLIKQ